ncbi:hypothetical protein MTO96_043490 [Rhipicephalus appendiculatus]
MYACVRYVQDDERAVLPVKLIKGFKAKCIGDLQKHREYSAYWVDEDGECENFYPATVTALADSLEQLLATFRTSRSPVPRLILGKISRNNSVPERLTEKEKKKRKRQAEREELGTILKAFKNSKDIDLVCNASVT